MSFPIHHVPVRTKWEIMIARLSEARKVVKAIEDELKWAERTPFTANGTGECSNCGTKLPTEADFWKHFPIPDERYLNIGYCPKVSLRKKNW